MTISGKHYNEVVNTEKSIESIDVDIKTNVVYWTDLDNEPKIKRAMIPLKKHAAGHLTRFGTEGPKLSTGYCS